jgi:ATPase subunit of ABC transporter with duplicated ATPase domains
VSLDSVCKSYGANVLLDNVSITIGRNDSIALIGANGCGKTTLLRLLMDEESCDNGIIKVSSNVKIAYMPQIIRFDDENATILEALRNATGLQEEKTRSILAGFRFKAPDALKKVGNLSGGERSRLKLCMLMQNKANFLILDEPTNHLDNDSREWIEEAVSEFDGTILFISHDRYFLNKFASRIWSMKDGGITDFIGGFEDYVKVLSEENKSDSRPSDRKNKKQSPVRTKKQPAKQISAEDMIYEAEAELEKVNAAINSNALNGDHQEINSLYEKKRRLEIRIETLYGEWANF